MIPENGKFTFISHATLSTSDTVIPVGTTHIVCANTTSATTYADVSGILAFKPDGSTLTKIIVPCGVFFRLGNIIPGTSDVLTNATTPASTITQVSFFKWEQ